ncbi:MAG: CopG family transcriptional regulator [Thermodesulfobacteriota bacterium]
MEKQNVTLSLPKSLLKEAKILAIRMEKSLSQLLVEALQDIIRRNQEYERSKQRHRMILEKGFDLGTRGDIKVKREELHERR